MPKWDFAYKTPQSGPGTLTWVIVEAETEYEAIKKSRQRDKRDPYAGPLRMTEKMNDRRDRD